jgi:hypothetical protein
VVEQRCQAVLAVIRDGVPIIEVAGASASRAKRSIGGGTAPVARLAHGDQDGGGEPCRTQVEVGVAGDRNPGAGTSATGRRSQSWPAHRGWVCGSLHPRWKLEISACRAVLWLINPATRRGAIAVDRSDR